MASNIDASLFYLINKTSANQAFDLIMPWISRLGRGDVIFVLALIFIFLPKREYRILAILLFACLTITYYSVDVLKHLVARPRPYIALAGAHILERAKDFSFPSGHATQAFAAAAIFASFFRKRAVFFTLAALVCLSRVYLGVHYVSDVIAGALLGSCIGYGLVLAARSSGFMPKDLF
jgi:undecaprenyl-diphosphatase